MEEQCFASDNSPSRSLVKADASALPTTLGPEIEHAAGYARAEKAEATRRAYRSDFGLFRAWCETKHVAALPASPEAVAAFLAAEANRGAKVATISRRLAAIRYAHKLAGHEPPTNVEAVKATLRGIRRTAGCAPVRKAPTCCRIHNAVGCHRCLKSPERVITLANSEIFFEIKNTTFRF